VTPGVTGEVALTPNRPKVPDGTRRLLLAGDVTALPAINSWVEQAPKEWQIDAFIADDHPERESLPVSRRAGATLTWIPADGGLALARAVAAAGADEGTYAWAAGEKELVKHVRGAFKDALGLAKPQQFSQFYWFEGRETG
jgi:ATP-binding cassette subfamily B protein IrtA